MCDMRIIRPILQYQIEVYFKAGADTNEWIQLFSVHRSVSNNMVEAVTHNIHKHIWNEQIYDSFGIITIGWIYFQYKKSQLVEMWLNKTYPQLEHIICVT